MSEKKPAPVPIPIHDESGSMNWSNPSPEEIAEEVAGEAALRREMAEEAREGLTVDQVADVLGEHHIFPGVMVSPGHWAHQRGPDGQLLWFVHCGTSYEDQKGCGWSSEPHVFTDKMEAKRAGLLHVAEKLKEAGL